MNFGFCGRLIAVSLIVLCASCGGGGEDTGGGGGSPPAPAPAPPTPAPSGIGAAGGTVTEASGAQVVIPANALSTATNIAVTQNSAGAPALPAGVTAYGPIYALTPHGTSFAVPVTITVPFDPTLVPAGEAPTLYKTNGSLTDWQVVAGAFVNGNTMVGEVTGFSDPVVGSKPPPALEPGIPERHLIVFSRPLDHSTSTVVDSPIIPAGTYDENYDFGPAKMIDPWAPLPEIPPRDPYAAGHVFSSPGGGSYGVSAEAPIANGEKSPAGNFSNYRQSQSYRIKSKNAKLRLKITQARIEAFDDEAADPPPCEVDPHSEAVRTSCNGQMSALVHVSVSVFNKRFGQNFHGYLLLNGWRGHWTPVKEFPTQGMSGTLPTQLWTEDQIDFNDDVGPQGGRQAHLGLKAPLVVPVDLHTDDPNFQKDEEFTLKVEVSIETFNGRPGKEFSYLGAFYRDPTLEDGNAEVITEGLEPTNNPQEEPTDPDLPGTCPSKLPAGTLMFASPNYTVPESAGASGVELMVLRTGGRSGEVSATLATHEGTAREASDYTPVQTTVTFADGDVEPKYIHVPLVYSTFDEDDAETFTATLTSPQGCATLAQPSTIITILDDTRPVPLPHIYSLGGTVSGLAGTGLTLRTNAFDQVQIAGNGPFTFPLLLTDGTTWSVTVAAQPANPVQNCSLTNNSGTIAAASVTNIQVSCVTPPPQSGLDQSFGSAGKVFSNTGGASKIVQQSDGKLLTLNSILLARFNTDGTPDTTFGTAGVVNIVTGGASADEMKALAVQPDGKIVVVGHSSKPPSPFDDFLVMRFTADGNLDATFGTFLPSGTPGKVVTDFDGRFDFATAVMLQTDGKILVAGYAQVSKIDNTSGTPVPFFDQDFAVVRYLPDGRLDTTYGTNGKSTMDIGALGLEYLNAAALQSDGSVVAVGRTTLPNGGGIDMAVARFLDTGAPDMSFGPDHNGHERLDFSRGGVAEVTFNGGQTDEALAVVVQNPGEILVAGYSFNSSNVAFGTVFRLLPNGDLDRIIAVSPSFSKVNGVALQADHSIVIAGESSSDFALQRFSETGVPDDAFGTRGTDGLLTVDFFGMTDRARDVLVQSDGRIVAAGSAVNGSGGGTGIVRVNP